MAAPDFTLNVCPVKDTLTSCPLSRKRARGNPAAFHNLLFIKIKQNCKQIERKIRETSGERLTVS
jgi:hypothetical protein